MARTRAALVADTAAGARAHHPRMTKASAKSVTPFDWRRYTAAKGGAPGNERQAKPAARRAKRLTVGERVERIMAPRWGNPYCKPGPAY